MKTLYKQHSYLDWTEFIQRDLCNSLRSIVIVAPSLANIVPHSFKKLMQLSVVCFMAHTWACRHSSCSYFLFSAEIAAAGANQHHIQEICVSWPSLHSLRSDLNSIHFKTKESATMLSAPNTSCLSIDPSLHNFLHSLVSLTLFFCVFRLSLPLSWHLVCLGRNLLTQLWSPSQTFTHIYRPLTLHNYSC